MQFLRWWNATLAPKTAPEHNAGIASLTTIGSWRGSIRVGFDGPTQQSRCCRPRHYFADADADAHHQSLFLVLLVCSLTDPRWGQGNVESHGKTREQIESPPNFPVLKCGTSLASGFGVLGA